MKIQDLMTRSVVVIGPNATLQEAGEKMKEFDIGVLPVWENHQLLGVITDRDIAIRSVAAGHDPQSEKVAKAMTGQVHTCFEDQTVAEAARLMTENQVRRLIVLDRDERLIGIISLGDVAVDSGNEQLAGGVLHEVCATEPVQGVGA